MGLILSIGAVLYGLWMLVLIRAGSKPNQWKRYRGIAKLPKRRAEPLDLTNLRKRS